MLNPRVFVVLLMLARLSAADPQVVDKPVRYIERDMITLQDVQEHLLMRLRAQKQGVPNDRRALEALHIESLEHLTDEALILQEADRMRFEISEQLIYADVANQLEEAQQVPDPRVLAVLAKKRMRMIKIHTVTKHYTDMAPNIRPEDIEHYYEEHKDDYQRPARWDTYQILIIPSDDKSNKRVFNGLVAVYRSIQNNPQEKIKALINPEISKKFLALPFGGIEQIRFLQNICKQLAALKAEDVGPVTKELLEEATRWSTAADAIRNKEQVEALLSEIADEITGLDEDKRLDAFRAHADVLTMGLGASKGGELGMLELDSQTPAVQVQLKELKDGDCTKVFWSGDAAILLYVSEFEPGLTSSFNDVNGKIRKLLEQQQQTAVRQDLIRQLREEATIKDID